jgi:imidazoleglycerol phosphate dehydratase HisB
MTGFLDLSAGSAQKARRDEARLRERLAAILDCPAERVALAISPDAARRALAGAGLDIDQDRAGEGALSLDRSVGDTTTLVQVGPEAAPVTAIVFANAADADSLSGSLPGLPPLLAQAGLDALSPGARMKAVADRAERDRVLATLVARLGEEAGVGGASCVPEGLSLDITDQAATRLGLGLELRDGRAIAHVEDAAAARALSQHLGVSASLRAASVRRTTKETDIALAIDLDGEGASVSTGVHFFDHMLEQIARHAGIGLQVSCEGDVEVDAHHTIEDVCLALGDGLRQALGDKRGIGRFGFALPMDETRASVWIDLSGRPYFRFDGSIPGERVGDFPVEMAPHAFRSISETLKASIHVEVDGENAHHLIESAFKAFGRALRQAIRIEDDALPSTKGVL